MVIFISHGQKMEWRHVFFKWRFFLDPIIVISLVTVRNCNIFFFIWKGLLRLVKQYMLKYQLWPMSSRWRRPGQSMAHKRNFLHKKVPLFGQCLLLYSESGWLNHWASTNCPKCINPVCWFSEHKTLPIPTPLTSCDCVGMCVCEHSLVVPFSSPPLCGCRPKTAVRGIRGTIHQLPVNTKYICCILHHQYINTEYINTKYARCILGPPSLSWVLSSRKGQANAALIAPPGWRKAFTMMWHKKRFCTNSHDHKHTLIFVCNVRDVPSDVRSKGPCRLNFTDRQNAQSIILTVPIYILHIF